MRVRVEEIPPGGLTVAEQLDPANLNLETPDIRFTGPLTVKAFLEREGDAVEVRVEAAGPTEQACRRCLEPTARPFETRFELSFPVGSDDVLDLTPDIRGELFLNYPVEFLCRADCLGLCTRCGANLNQGGCRCAAPQRVTRSG
ncbi:MAG: hypothetical protein COV76_07990 [Candidatus Omnitrophica bacterium CG11_big_fil_rev_8_21_14_0_20_64_10]|nr:MAG: hypothetical protein COV76_07990 [Candidatus Omnitrophica bacterium CG11_big_fil_rev_8_21_14_0_20_64_10]